VLLHPDVDLEHLPNQLIRHRSCRHVIGHLGAPVQHDDAVGKANREIEIVQDRDDGGAIARAPLRGFHQLDLVPQIEARGWLVQQQQAGSVHGLAARELHQHAGKMRALLLAARQGRKLAMAETGQSGLLQRGLDQRLGGGAAEVARAHMNDFVDRKREADTDVLRQHRAMQGELAWRIGVKIALLQPDLTAAGAKVAGEKPQQGRLAGAVRADDGNHLAAFDPQVDAVDQRGGADRHRYRARFEQRRHSATNPR